MFKAKNTAATFAVIIVLLSAFHQPARAESWSWKNLFSFGLPTSSVVDCTTDPVVTSTGNNGTGTLRQAVIDACAGSTVTFDSTVTDTILLNGQIIIDKDLTIQGPGANVLKVRNLTSGEIGRIFKTNAAVKISDLTITGGRAYRSGGAISAQGNLTLTNVMIKDSVALRESPFSSPNTAGGGIYNLGTLTLINSSVSSSHAASGGGIYSFGGGTLNIINSDVSGNSGSGSGGAGIFNGGTANISNSTISGNWSIDAQVEGGGLYNRGTAILTNSTVSNNSLSIKYVITPTTGGAGIGNDGTLTLINTTVANNTIDSASYYGGNGHGAGIHNRGGTVNVRNSIIAGNSGTVGSTTGWDFHGTMTSQGYNLLGDNGQTVITGDTTGNIVGTHANPIDARIEPLADNGGITKTHALLAGSPAINTADTANAPLADQRGATRLDAADIGAFEFNGLISPSDCPPVIVPEKIAFASFRDGNGEIYSMNTDGTSQTRLTNIQSSDVAPSFSGDGKRIAFTSFSDGDGEIYVMNADGSGVTRLTDNASIDSDPSFSSDGTKIVFYSSREGSFEVFVMNADGSNQVNVSNNPANDWNPSFNADGSRITFESTRDGNSEIYVMNADGSGQTRLTINGVSDRYPSFSPDGSKIAYASYRNGAYQIYVVNADGSGEIRLTNSPGSDIAPAFSPDGKKIAFQSTRDGNDEIYVVNADGSGEIRLTNDSHTDASPSWSRQVVTNPCVNTAPVAVSDSYGMYEDNLLDKPASGVLSNDTGNETSPLTATLVSAPSNASAFVLNADGSFSYTPVQDFYGTDSFTYTASDGSLTSNIATVTITVTEINDAPSIVDEAYSIDENSTLTVSVPDLLANDSTGPANESGQTLTLGQVSETTNTNGMVSLNNGQIIYQPAANFSGIATFDYFVCDNGTTAGTADWLCDVGTVRLTINAVNRAPVANSGSITTDEDTPSTVFRMSGSDADNDVLTFELVTAPVKGTYDAVTGIYTPNANFSGSDSFTFIARDAVSQSSPATVSITVNSVNDASTADAQSVTTDEDVAKTIILSGSDIEGDSLTFNASQPSHGTVSCTGASCLYTPEANYNGADSFTFKTNDSQTDSSAATVSITINPVNDPPTADTQSVTLDEDTVKSITLTGSDPDDANAPLTYTVVGQSGHGTLNGTGANLTYTPSPNYNGADSFTFRVSDGETDSETATVSITITPVNDNPSAVNDSAATDEDMAVLIDARANDSDIDGDTLSISNVGTASNGVASISNDGRILYTPNANFFGSDGFSYIVSDGNGGTSTANVSVTINSVNDLPVASNNRSTQTVQYSDPVQTVTITATDIETSAAALIAAAQFSTDNGINWQTGMPSGLVLSSNNNGTWTVSGIANLPAGSYILRAIITDADQGVASTSFTLIVNQETTATDYTGDFDLMTAGPAVTSASVRLAATLTQDADGALGDLTKATVTFKVFKFNATTATFTIPNVPVDANGNAEVLYNLAADVYTIRAEIDGGNRYWTANPVNDGLLNITVPTNEQRSSGGGWVSDAASASGKARLAFSVTSSKNGQPKGNMSFSYKGTDGFTYLVKSNSWQGGYLQFAAEPGVAPTVYTRSKMKGNCTVQKIDPATGIVIESFGGYSFEIFTRDGDLLNPRQRDSFSITVRNSANAVFHQVGTATSLVTLGGGNITNKAK